MASDRWLYAWALTSVALGAASLPVPLYFVAVLAVFTGFGVFWGRSHRISPGD